MLTDNYQQVFKSPHASYFSFGVAALTGVFATIGIALGIISFLSAYDVIGGGIFSHIGLIGSWLISSGGIGSLIIFVISSAVFGYCIYSQLSEKTLTPETLKKFDLDTSLTQETALMQQAFMEACNFSGYEEKDRCAPEPEVLEFIRLQTVFKWLIAESLTEKKIEIITGISGDVEVTALAINLMEAKEILNKIDLNQLYDYITFRIAHAALFHTYAELLETKEPELAKTLSTKTINEVDRLIALLKPLSERLADNRCQNFLKMLKFAVSTPQNSVTK